MKEVTHAHLGVAGAGSLPGDGLLQGRDMAAGSSNPNNHSLQHGHGLAQVLSLCKLKSLGPVPILGPVRVVWGQDPLKNKVGIGEEIASRRQEGAGQTKMKVSVTNHRVHQERND